MRLINIFLAGLIVSSSVNAAWVDYIDPEVTYNDGYIAGMMSECRKATYSKTKLTKDRSYQKFEAAASDGKPGNWVVDKKISNKLRSVFDQGFSSGQADAKSYKRSSRSNFEREICYQYDDMFESLIEKSLPESMMDGSFFKQLDN